MLNMYLHPNLKVQYAKFATYQIYTLNKWGQLLLAC